MQDALITFLASFLIWFMFGGLFVLWLIDGKVKKEVALHAFFAAAIAWGIAQLIKELFPATRPFMENGKEALTLVAPIDGAFPSGHTSAVFALATTVWLHHKRIGLAFMVTAFTIGIARVLANVHYPVDILGGAVLGVLVSVFIEKVHLVRG